MRSPIEHRIRINEGFLTVFEWLGKAPSLIFVHATGFHARCWDQVISQLPDHHCYAVDMRGHGRSFKPAPPYHWRPFAEDLKALGEILGWQDTIGIGHSMGGHSVALATALSPGIFAKLLLIDPTILTKSWYTGIPFQEDHFVTRRRNHWHSADEMFHRFKDRTPFSNWNPAVLRDYCEYGLLPSQSGDDLILACPPEIEGSIYNHSIEANIYSEIATIEIPVQIARAGRAPVGLHDLSASPTAPDLANYFSNGKDSVLPDCSHFIPMEAPERVAELVKQVIEHE